MTLREAIPISEHHARQLEPAIPRFRDEGAVYGGPAIVDAGESRENVDGVNVIYREGSEHVRAPEAPRTRAASVEAAAGRVAQAAAVDAPQADPHRAPPMDSEGSVGNRTHGGLGSGKGGGTVGAAGGPVKIEGELKIEGMADWVARVEGFMRDV
jgi:hypothetical protein